MQKEENKKTKMQDRVESTAFVEMGFSLKNRSYLWALEYHITSLPLCTRWESPDLDADIKYLRKDNLISHFQGQRIKDRSAKLFHI